MIGILLFMVWVILLALSFFLNRDVFSPTKFYLLNIGAYFGLIFIKPYESFIYIYYLIFLLIGLVYVFIEPKRNMTKLNQHKENIIVTDIDQNSFNKAIITIWILSIIPILAQLHLIQYMGGLSQYINTIGLRVVEWRGKGATLELIKLYGVINIFYFSLLIIRKKFNLKIWAPYIIHFIIFIIIGLLTGSRGTLLWNIVYMLMSVHYLRKRVPLRKAMKYAVILLVIASILGIARNGYKLTEEGFKTGLSNYEQSFDTKQFEYGITPIEIVYNVKTYQIEYGKTYLTPITNLVPRNIWPEKPDTGGIIFTQRYTADAWGGYSHLATGIVTEGIINFGMFWGPIIGFLLFIIVMLMVFRYYKLTFTITILDMKSVVIILSYIYIVTSLPGLVKSEWTNTVLDVAFKTFKLWFIYYVVHFVSNKLKISRT